MRLNLNFTVRSIVFVLFTAVTAFAQKPSFTCGTCHTKEAAAQPNTPMGKALQTPGHNPLFQENKDLKVTAGRFAYAITTKGDKTTYTVSDGAGSLSLPIRWTFGKGAQTFVLERGGQFIESLVSYYPEIGALDVTLGDERLNPQSLEDAIGRKLELREITDCFNCHSTQSGQNHKLELASLVPGVTCERCHQNSNAHLASVSGAGGRAVSALVKPEALGRRSAESISTFCGQCHRSWQTVVRNNWMGQMNVRFQPYRLENSRCFDGADARISCVACHNPHEDLVTETTSYDKKCLACHANGGNSIETSRLTANFINTSLPAIGKQSGAKACPVAKSNCVSCHMPRVRLPGGHQTFTDHQIRVVHASDAYPN